MACAEPDNCMVDDIGNSGDEARLLTNEISAPSGSRRFTKVLLLISFTTAFAGAVFLGKHGSRVTAVGSDVLGFLSEQPLYDTELPICFLATVRQGCDCGAFDVPGVRCGCRCPSSTLTDCFCPAHSEYNENTQHFECAAKYEANPGLTHCISRKDVRNACFPGDATVTVQGTGAKRISDVNIGDLVLVQRPGTDELLHEPVLAFLHKLRHTEEESSTLSYVAITHAHGELHASAEHLVFLAGGVDAQMREVRPGDRLRVVVDGKLLESDVLSVSSVAAGRDAYAPLTASGTVVVDGVVASNYASVQGSRLAHAVAHAMLFPVRAYHACFQPVVAALQQPLPKLNGDDELHAYVGVLMNTLHLGTLHGILIGKGA